MKELITFIEANLNKQKLEKITTSVIDAYRSEDDFMLKTTAMALHIQTDGVDRKKLFYELVKRLHPDRLTSLQSEFTDAVRRSDLISLSGLKKLLDMKAHLNEVKKQRYDYDFTEDFRTGPDPAMGFDEEDQEDLEDEGSFINAVKREIFGNHNFSIDPSDLGQIDGVLNLQDYDLEDLDGIEHCLNVHVLNIAGNDIFNLYDLQFLTQLVELYASGNRVSDLSALSDLRMLEIIDMPDNDVEDLSPLLKMDKLRFADFRNNPVSDRTIVRMLEEQGVIVLI